MTCYTSYKLNIVLSDPAKVLSLTPVDNTTVVATNQLTLNCSFEGNPPPSVSWVHNGSMVDTSDPNLSETLTEGYSLLDVTFIDINDTGEYVCVVNNSIGMNQSESVFFTVQGNY